MNLASRWFRAAICLAILFSSAVSSWAQSTPLPTQDVSAIYKRLLPQIEKIPIVDMHAHPGYWDDSDVDAMAVTVTDLDPFRTRDTNPEWAAAAKALFGYPYSDLSREHAAWLDEFRSLRSLPGEHFTALAGQNDHISENWMIRGLFSVEIICPKAEGFSTSVNAGLLNTG